MGGEKRKKILLIDEDPDTSELFSGLYKNNEFTFLISKNGEDALKIAKKYSPEIVFLDVMLPDIDGIEVCEKIRELSEMKNAFIAFLTEHNEAFTQISAFKVGADDFIRKPISPELLKTKINVYIKAYDKIISREKKYDGLIINTGSFMIYPSINSVLKNNKFISLTQKEFNILVILASNQNKVVSRDDIYKKLWGENSNVLEKTINVHVKNLREKIGGLHIVTIKKFGFKFIDN